MKRDFIVIFFMIFLPGLHLMCRAQSDSTAVAEEDSSLKWNPRVSIWWEFYNESTIMQQYNDNLISCSHTKPGIRITGLLGRTAEFYFLLRYGKDQHRDYWSWPSDKVS